MEYSFQGKVLVSGDVVWFTSQFEENIWSAICELQVLNVFLLSLTTDRLIHSMGVSNPVSMGHTISVDVSTFIYPVYL